MRTNLNLKNPKGFRFLLANNIEMFVSKRKLSAKITTEIGQTVLSNLYEQSRIVVIYYNEKINFTDEIGSTTLEPSNTIIM